MAPFEEGARAPPTLHARLPRMAPAEAALRNALLSALNGLASEAGRITAAIERAGPPEVRLRFANGLAARPLTLDAAPVSWLDVERSPILPEALVELSRLEPMLAAVERALALALEPDRLVTSGEGLAVRLAIRDETGADRHALRLAVPFGLRPAPRRSPPRLADIGAAARALVGARLILTGPVAPLAELARLSRGDLILAKAQRGGLPGCLDVFPGLSIAGLWRPSDSLFTCEAPMDETSDAAAAAAGAAGLPAEMTVRLALELGPIEVTLGELAALAPGAVLAARLSGDAPEVVVMAGGARIASGRLMAVGDAYGVLIEAVSEAAKVGGEAAA